jgi:ATP-dependent RNA helicase SUPV3L1/SUV3
VPSPEEVSILAPVPEPEATPEMEAFYTFTWAPKPRSRPERGGERGPRPERKDGEAPRAPRGDRPQGDRPQGDRPRREGQGDRPKHDRPKGDRPKGDFKGKPNRDDRQKSYEARPPRAEKPIDPDNPFAALLALKGKV